MNKKLMIMTAAAGLLSFVGTFVFAWFTKSSAESPGTEEVQPILATEEPILKLPTPQAPASYAIGQADSKMKRAMTEKRLKSLVYEVRERIQEYDSKLEYLGLREQRVQMAQDMLKKDIEEINNLRIELVSTVAGLKSARDKLLKSRIQIYETEVNNLISIAAAYDKMDPEPASEILTTMSQAQNSSADDAVKILHYMTEKKKAELLAQLVTSEPKLAAYFCTRLKQIVEKE